MVIATGNKPNEITPYAMPFTYTSNSVALSLCSLSFCDHITYPKRPNPADILDLAAKSRLIRDDDDTLL